jgi:hypothetical protein
VFLGGALVIDNDGAGSQKRKCTDVTKGVYKIQWYSNNKLNVYPKLVFTTWRQIKVNLYTYVHFVIGDKNC